MADTTGNFTEKSCTASAIEAATAGETAQTGSTEGESATAKPGRPEDVVRQLREALEAVEPYLDSIVCYASTMGEHEPNRIAHEVRAVLGETK